MSTQATDVPAKAIFDFDIHTEDLSGGDVHRWLASIHRRAPDIFYTPHNGGHWVISRYDLIEEVVKDYERFSSAEMQVPRVPNSLVAIPLNLDPPRHTGYRVMLMKHFGPATNRRLEPRIRHWAQHLIAQVAPRGHADFAEEVGSAFPVSVFMELMGMPRERLAEYRQLAVDYFGKLTPERRIELEQRISSEMRELIELKRQQPGDDLISALTQEKVDGRPLEMAELEALCNLLFQAGMDTVVNFAAFLFSFLARSPETQAFAREHPERMADIVEEGFRMFGVSNSARLVTRDTELAGMQLRAGDMVVCMLPLAGRDERRNPDPDRFDVDRKQRQHLLFSQGVHLCIGHSLARLEMRILLEEWFKAIPEFRLPVGFVPKFRVGQVMGLSHLPLEWDPA